MPQWRVCTRGYEEAHEECASWREESYDECRSWGKTCKKWIPVPIIGDLICGLTEAVCLIVVTIVDWVCELWNLVTTFVCLVWETVMFLVSVLGVIVKAILAIPIVGALIRQTLNFITSVVIGLVGFFVEGVLCGLAGICPAKKLRLCVVILQYQEGPLVSESELQPLLDRTKQIFKDEANVTIYSTVSNFPHERGDALEPACGFQAWLDDFWLTGTQYQEASYLNCQDYAVPSLIGLGSPIYAYAVRDIEGSKNGCSLGPLTNYVVFEPKASCMGNKTHLAHELGHACNLWHVSDTTNLMYENCVASGRDQLSGFQKSIVRGSKYVTYF